MLSCHNVSAFYHYAINQDISYWLSYRSKLSCIGPKLRTNTTDLRPLSEPMQNLLINDIFIIN